tara:strand:+ start:98 stop:550 length:453 start_codon:yes stop_codon:yes gene_type:complete
MANDCYLWFRLIASRDTLDKLVTQLKTIGYNGCYGYSCVENINDTTIEVRGTTKNSPPIDMFTKWLENYSDLKVECLFKEEFLYFAGKWMSDNDTYHMVDFKTISSQDVKDADSGYLYELQKKLYLAEHMDDHYFNDHYEDNRRLLHEIE